MDLQKGKVLLEKINALYKNMSADPHNISSIERGLMRSYLCQMYENFLEIPVSAAPPAVDMPVTSASVEVVSSAPKITLRRPEPPPPQPEPPKPEPPKVEVAPQPEPPKPELPKVEVAPEPAPVLKETPPQAAPPVFSSRAAANPELEELFAIASARELSEKLSEQPITDIKKAMGLNDRVLTINELFGNDNAAFDATVATLNSLRSFEEAKDYLIRNVADQYHWASKDKKSKAKEFIKLVKRRY